MNRSFRPLILICIAVVGCVSSDYLAIAAPTAPTSDSLQDGDIVFQHMLTGQSRAIQLATHSEYSHMGILFQQNNGWYVYEAVGPVKMTPLQEWIAQGQGSHYTVKRLKDSKVLTLGGIAKLRAAGKRFLGKPYDAYFEWSDDRIYCSELVWKMYKEGLGIEIGQLAPLQSFDLEDPVVKAKLKERFGKHVPLDAQVVAPSTMFNSPVLFTVSSH